MASYLDRFRGTVRLDSQEDFDLVPFLGTYVGLDAPQFAGVFKLDAFGIDPVSGEVLLYSAGLGSPLRMMSHQKLYVDYQAE